MIASDLESVYEENYTNLTPAGQNTIQLVFWDIIQNQIGIS